LDAAGRHHRPTAMCVTGPAWDRGRAGRSELPKAGYRANGTCECWTRLLQELGRSARPTEIAEHLTPLIADLPEREQTVLALRLFGNQTQSQIGETIGVSHMHVSRLLDRALKHLRKGLESDVVR
jgi:DNA-directed RNA polymerase specialized sigma24 family protein